MWTGKQLFSLIFRPNNENPINVNFDAIGKSYVGNRELGVEDSYVIMRNSELLAGNLDKNHLGSSGKGGNILYLILRDYGSSAAIKAMSRLARFSTYFLMNTGFSLGIKDVSPNDRLKLEMNNLLSDG